MSEMMSGASPMRSSTPSASQAAAGLEALEPLGLEHADERTPHAGLVVHDETVGGAGHDRLRVLECRHGFTVYFRWVMDATNIHSLTLYTRRGEMSSRARAPARPRALD